LLQIDSLIQDYDSLVLRERLETIREARWLTEAERQLVNDFVEHPDQVKLAGNGNSTCMYACNGLTSLISAVAGRLEFLGAVAGELQNRRDALQNLLNRAQNGTVGAKGKPLVASEQQKAIQDYLSLQGEEVLRTTT
jgi:hypothetical protein